MPETIEEFVDAAVDYIEGYCDLEDAEYLIYLTRLREEMDRLIDAEKAKL
ncbi:MAG: hypothetical protein Q8L89_04310 [Gammaproteobacteria bacterium]|nr:hypothetical protein [Gammaproteobacteria bacterium]